jgi:hypothetical protein
MLYTKSESRIENDSRMFTGLTCECVCVYCGDSFKSRCPLAKYCSQRCKNDAYIERRKQRHEEQLHKICACCGKDFIAKKVDSMYCSNACKQKAYRLKKKDVTD